MKLTECAEVVQGAFVNRIETSHLNEDSVQMKLVTLKEFNHLLGIDYRVSQEKDKSIYVRKESVREDILTDDKSLVLHTLTQKVVWFPPEYAGLLLTNNFMKIKPSREVDVHFLEWLLNEHPDIQKQISIFKEGSIISSLKLSNVRELEITLPPLSQQQRLGQIARLKKRKGILLKDKSLLSQQLIQQQMLAVCNK